MEVYGLTGGIGSGKSTVASLLEEYGIPVVSADELSRIVVAPGSEGLRQVVEEFGAEMVDEAGELDRGKMASLVFRNPERRRRLEEILHPRIRERFEQVLDALEKAGHEVAIYEVPLLFEKNLQGEMKAVILVTAPDHVRVARVRNRDDVTETEVRARMAAQMDETSKRRRADYVIENDGNVDDLRREVEFLIARFLRVGVGRRAPGVDEPATPEMLDDRDRSYDPISAPAPSRRLTEVPTEASQAEVAVRTGNTLPPGVATSSSIASAPGIGGTMPAPGISSTMPAPGISATMPAPGRTVVPAPVAPPSAAPSTALDPPTPPSMPRVGLPPLPGAPPSQSDESSAATMPLGARLPPESSEPVLDDAAVAAASRPTVVSVHEPPSAPPLRKPDAGKSEPGRPAAARPVAPRRVSTLAAPTLGAPIPPPPPARPPSAIGKPGPTPVPPAAKPPIAGATPTVAASAVPPPPPRGRTERYVPVKEAQTPGQTAEETPASPLDREPDDDV